MTKLRQLWLLTALGSIVVLAAGYFLMVSPKASKAAAIRTEAADQEAANTRLRGQIAMLNRQKKDLPRQQAELQKFAARIPNNPALPALIRSLSDAADNAGVELIGLSPSLPTRVTMVPTAGAVTPATTAAATASTLPLAQIQVSMKVTGKYSQLSQFFSEIEGVSRAFLLNGVNVVPGDAGAQSSGASVTGSTTTATSQTGPVYDGTLTATITGSLFMTVKPLATAPQTAATTAAN